ncbi:hypothetical protein E3O42_01945 [Cryobacterium adonitolivorans]|uniref:Transcriptional regulator, AbiEi antitoxin, Type IV TA system n=1 Tax=Cryobacterium adonitolivorans TaxID=1259189 RepID=A0A4R8WG56_9MICO|nr:hypothetical protein [Cryobacterium adonitolivorans]TFC05925.1 hypothetical protein E3O42_01945 [Cryobacterium adonitolivorans]
MTVDRLDPQTGLFLVKKIGVSDTDARQARREVDLGQAIRLRRGVLTTAERWAALGPGHKYLDRIRAVVETRRLDPVVSHQSAAALWGIPLGGAWPRAVHVLVRPESHARSKNGVLVHRTEFDWEEIVEIDGMLVTSPARTLLDLARTVSFADAVVALDHALNPDRADPRVLVYAEELSETLARVGSARGQVRAQRAIDFARPNAANPGESLSRVAIFELGFPDPELQVPHRNPRGGWYFTDHEWRASLLIGEFDGKGKYLKEEYLRGRSPGEVVYEEKIREDHLRAEGFTVVRWGWAELTDRATLRRILRGAGLPVIR